MHFENILRAFVEEKFIEKVINKANIVIGSCVRYLWAFTIPIDTHKIVFMTYSNSFICNPKYIQLQLAKEGVPYDMVWICNKGAKNINVNFPDTVRVVKRGTLEAYREIASAKIWIDNSINFLWRSFPKKKGQIYIETWHGSLGLKRVGKSDVKNLHWVKASKKCNTHTDYCISNSTFENFVYRDTHWPKTEIWMLGHARNDILLSKDPQRIAEIKKKVYQYFSLDENDKILLYAPTFRDNGDISVYDIDFPLLKETLEICFGGSWKILLRYHFHNRKRSLQNPCEYILDATKYIDMQELLCVTDIGISDYSSWLCDFILTKRPAFIYATDLQEYNTERGLYYPLETTPFPVATNNEELMQNIRQFHLEQYLAASEIFLAEKGCIDDGHASERIVSKIKEIMET